MKLGILSCSLRCYSTRRLREAAEQRGHKVKVLDTLKFAIDLEKGDPDLYFRRRQLSHYDAVLPRVGASITYFGTAVVRQFEQMDVFCANTSGGISNSRDKLRSLQILSRHHIGIPQTTFVRDKKDVLPAIERVGGAPVIIKLIEGTQGIGVLLAETVKSAEAIIELLQSQKQSVLIQKFVAESKGRDIRAFVVGDQVVGAMRRVAQGQEFRSNVHRGGVTEPVVLDETYCETAIRAAQIMGLRVAGVDMLEGKDGPQIMEVNSSPGLEGIERCTQLDIAGSIIDYIAAQVDFPEIDTAALHGDEINGTGAVRQLIQDESFELLRGSVVLVPVLNLLAFDRHSRYLPDRRDLNRSFPGSSSGSLAGRMARTIFDEIVSRCDYGIDLHTAAVRRTNYPNVRADLSDTSVRRLAEAFGCEVNIDSKGPKGAFRREACLAGCPTIIMEGGEVWKVEPGIVDTATRGIRNVLRELEMLDGDIETPDYQVTIQKSKWIRAEKGGFLQFHIKPGDIIEKDQPLATNTTLLGRERSVLHAPFDAVVIGMTTLPATSPGEPVCNLGKLPKGTKPSAFQRSRREEDGLEERVSEELASNVLVVDPSE